MTPITNATEALVALRNYEKAMPSSLPERLTKSLTAAAEKISPVEAAVYAAEALYAFKADLDDEGRKLCYGLTAWCYSMSFHKLGGDRGHGICVAMLRDLKTAAAPGTKWPKPEADPEADETYLVQTQPDPVIAPVVMPSTPPVADTTPSE